MSLETCTTTVGVFSNRGDAEAAISALHQNGFTADEIGIVTRNSSGTVTTARGNETPTEVAAENAGEGALAGAVAGAGIGGLIGVAVLSNAIPVVGPALFAGTLGVLASNAVGGAAVAGIVGALAGWGVSQEDATYYESEVVAGRTIVTVTSNRPCEEGRVILNRFGALTRS
jgi:hypothetical protein